MSPNKISDEDLISKIKIEAEDDSFKELVSRHENLYYKICHKYLPALSKNGVTCEDVFSDKYYVFFSSLNSFDSLKKVKFSTWLANQTRFNCLNKISNLKNKILVDKEEISAIIDQETSMKAFREKSLNVNMSSILESLKSLNDDRIAYIFERKYSTDKVKWKTIAEELNVTTQTVLNLHKKGVNYLRKKIKIIDIYE